MKWTNNHDLPLAIYNAIANSDYSKDGADFSVTELAMSAQERRLFRLHHSEIEKDIIQNIWALLGSSMHYILEKASGTSTSKLLAFREQQIKDMKEIILEVDEKSRPQNMGDMPTEKRTYRADPVADLLTILARQPAEVNSHLMVEERQWTKLANQTISGQVDVYDSDTATVQDYKVTGVFSYMKHMRGESRSWEIQLNCYRYLLVHNNLPVRKLEIIPIFRDWKGFEKFKDNYPPTPIMVLDMHVMEDIDVVQYMLDRIRIHSEATRYNNAKELAEHIPCTDLERWADKKFSIKKVGGKVASATFDTLGEAKLYEGAHPQSKYIISDKSKYKKCDEYCDVAQFCAQHHTISQSPAAPPVNLDDILIPEKPVDTQPTKLEDTPIGSVLAKTVEEKPVSALDRIKASRLLKEQEQAAEVKVEPVIEEVKSTTVAKVDSIVNTEDEKPVSLFEGSESIDDALKMLKL